MATRTGKARKPLAEFARDRNGRHGPGRWFDRLPSEIKAEAIAGWKAGLGATDIYYWLKDECQVDGVTTGRVHSGLDGVPRETSD
jgi:hypothetical protein